MPERQWSNGSGYRYGFNGKENDSEVKGQGAQYDYGFRIYDPRIGKFLSVDPLMKSYPWYTPYQFAGNKPIWAIDLDGLEEFYYYGLGGWMKSSHFAGPYTESYANSLGYSTAQQVHKWNEDRKREREAAEARQRRQEAIEAVKTIQGLNNPFGIIKEFNPVTALIDAGSALDNGQYTAAALFAVGAFSDLSPLLRTVGKEYTALAKSLATKYSVEQTWKLHPFFRGAIIEARVASSYVTQGFEWMAESSSKYFPKFDFYNKAKGLAVSLKTVNAEKNFDFTNIMTNIDELSNLKGKSMAVFNNKTMASVEILIKDVRLDIAIPKGYDKNNLKKVTDAAASKGVTLNIFEH